MTARPPGDAPMFNPRPRVELATLFDDHRCVVVDDALADPQAWVDWACAHRAQFTPSVAAYPGVERWLDEPQVVAMRDFFSSRVRAALGGRRVINASCRASLVTLAPSQLEPRQRLCHRDDRGLPPGERMFASVLYLFEDPALGGTSFFAPRRSAAETDALVGDSLSPDARAFDARHPEVAPGYMVEGNAWFERRATVPARFNRMIFYDGGVYHSGDIRHPERMSADPATGRLTFNGFFRCRAQAG